MEREMLKKYFDGVANNFIVFAAVVVPELADKAAEIAKRHVWQHSDRQPIDFSGNWVTECGYHKSRD